MRIAHSVIKTCNPFGKHFLYRQSSLQMLMLGFSLGTGFFVLQNWLLRKISFKIGIFTKNAAIYSGVIYIAKRDHLKQYIYIYIHLFTKEVKSERPPLEF